jgi:polysaccharide export outer membrane protein
VAGMTTRALEEKLELLLSKDYLLPFVQIKVTNQRVIIFPGKNSAQVIILQNTNTSLIEVIALANGIREDGFANSIKLMRKTGNKRAVYKIDLSTIEGLKQGEMLVQSNDYIYINSKKRIGREIIKDVAPWLSIFSSTLAIYALITK